MTEQNQQNEWQEVGSDFGPTIRWTEEPNNKWEEENTEFFGSEMFGIYKGKMNNIGQNNSTMHTLKTDNGPVSFWGTTVLDDKLKNIMNGYEVKIIYNGDKEPKHGGKKYKDFKVFHRKPVEQENSPSEDDINVDNIPY